MTRDKVRKSCRTCGSDLCKDVPRKERSDDIGCTEWEPPKQTEAKEQSQ